MPDISIIIPALNEAVEIGPCLANLASWRDQGHEVIVVDGGSQDATMALADGHCDILISAPAGRAGQMNAGAALAGGRLLLFLHADTRIPVAAEPLLVAMARSRSSREYWGRFDIVLSGAHPLLRIIEAMMNWRSRLTGIATGDQAIFASRQVFCDAGGYREIDLMEDIDLSARLRKITRPVCLRQRAVTSSRRWHDGGVIRTVIKMWCFRLGYFWGVSPARLKRLYDSG